MHDLFSSFTLKCVCQIGIFDLKTNKKYSFSFYYLLQLAQNLCSLKHIMICLYYIMKSDSFNIALENTALELEFSAYTGKSNHFIWLKNQKKKLAS